MKASWAASEQRRYMYIGRVQTSEVNVTAHRNLPKHVRHCRPPGIKGKVMSD